MVAVVIVWAVVFGLSPGLTLIAGALTLLVLDWLHPTILERVLDARG